MPTLSEMPIEEQRAAHDDPDLLRACSMTGSIRWLEIYRAYLLHERLQKAKRDEGNDILERWSVAMGITKGTLKNHLKYAYGIKIEDINEVFALEGIGGNEWTQRVGTSHLHIIARTRHTEEVLLTSRERAEWVKRAYHANLSVAELEQMLRDHDLLPPKRPSKLSPPTQSPTRAAQILRILADHMETKGVDSDLYYTLAKRDGKPLNIGAFLAWLGAEYRRDMPQAAFTLGEVATG